MTKLYFRGWDHLKACFGSEYVRSTIAPDGAKFNDLEAAIPLMAVEKPLDFESSISSESNPEEGYRTVATLFLATTSRDSEEQLEKVFSPALIEALQTHASDQVYGL